MNQPKPNQANKLIKPPKLRRLHILSLAFLLFLFLLFLLSCSANIFPVSPQTIPLSIKDQLFTLELAQTIPQKIKGLSGRTTLCSNCGMLFIYQNDALHTFWMKDTLIPLDIIWLSATGKIINISHSTPVEKDPAHPQNTYQPQLPARFVLELPAGSALSLGLKEDEQLNLPSLP